MSIRTTAASARRKRKLTTFLWISALTVLTISLIYWEKTALLYILATLGVTVLLIVVAVSDLHGSQATPNNAPEGNTSADI